MILLGNRYLIKKDKFEGPKNIILPERKDPQYCEPYTGEIVMIGKQVKNPKYNINDRVIFTEFGAIITDMMKDIDNDNIYVFAEEKSICGKFINKQS